MLDKVGHLTTIGTLVLEVALLGVAIVLGAVAGRLG
jgi:hypothetical protein